MQQGQQQPQQQQGIGTDPYTAYAQQAQNPYAYSQGGPQWAPGSTVH
jgi:hypothetical protein